jgi:hypothetical protein
MSATTTVETITETLLASAAEMAEKLEMRKEEKLDWLTTWDKQLMMLVTKDGINMGRVKVDYGEMRTYKYENFTLKGELVLEKRYGITETGWEHMPTVTYHLDEGTVIYTGW